jgi:putative hydrolase of the HAD superfamily
MDIENVKLLGLSTQRFPTSSVQAYEELARRSGHVPSREISEAVYRASAEVFQTQAKLYSDVDRVLKVLSRKSLIALLTKGDSEVQERRIDQSGLRAYFEVIDIVEEKSDSEFRSTLAKLGTPAADSWSIGNSLGSDIIPALSIGMRAVWIDAHVWGHERRRSQQAPKDDRFYEAKKISEVLDVIAT